MLHGPPVPLRHRVLHWRNTVRHPVTEQIRGFLFQDSQAFDLHLFGVPLGGQFRWGDAQGRELRLGPPAEYLGLATQTLAKMRWSGDSPPFFKVGRRVLYERDELDAWLAERKRTSTSDPGRTKGT